MIQSKIKAKYGILTKVFVNSGRVDPEIIDFAKSMHIDLIIMGTHGTSGYREIFIGSNTQRVVTLSDIPVLTIQKGVKKTEFKNILIPIDNL